MEKKGTKFSFWKKSFGVESKAWKIQKEEKPQEKEIEENDDDDDDDEKDGEGHVGRRGRDPFLFFFLLKKPPLKKNSWKTPTRAHTSPLYWTNGSTNF